MGAGSGVPAVTPSMLHPVDVEQAQPAHVGAVEGGVPGDGAEGVGPLVPKGRRVGLGPDAEAVQHDQKYTFCHSI